MSIEELLDLLTVDNIAWRIVHNAGYKKMRAPRWVHVRDATAYGAGVSQALCRRHGADPDELVGLDPNDEDALRELVS